MMKGVLWCQPVCLIHWREGGLKYGRLVCWRIVLVLCGMPGDYSPVTSDCIHLQWLIARYSYNSLTIQIIFTSDLIAHAPTAFDFSIPVSVSD